MRLLAILAALLCLTAPAGAATPNQRLLLLGGNPCAGIVVEANFGSGGLNCQNGMRYAAPTSLPGWVYARTGTATATDKAGDIIVFAANVPRITNLGILIEQTRTNSFLNSATGATQTVTTTAASWTLSFYGTGTIVMTGSCIGTLAGTGTTNRVTETVTATAGACILTVTGTATDVQFEAGAFVTSYIPTTGATATRGAETANVQGLQLTPSSVTVVALSPAQGPSTTLLTPLAYLSDGTTMNALEVTANGVAGSFAVLTVSGGTNSTTLNFTGLAGSIRGAASLGGTTLSATFNAATVQSETVTLPVSLGTLTIGQNVNNGKPYSAFVSEVKVLNRTLTGAALQTIQ